VDGARARQDGVVTGLRAGEETEETDIERTDPEETDSEELGDAEACGAHSPLRSCGPTG
jgi:hypothetical protein